MKTSVLRFWEGEFQQLRPVRTPSGQRLYSLEHIALLRRIKSLLYDEGLTIEGARKRLDEGEGVQEPEASVHGGGPTVGNWTARDGLLQEVADELRSLLRLLDRSDMSLNADQDQSSSEK